MSIFCLVWLYSSQEMTFVRVRPARQRFSQMTRFPIGGVLLDSLLFAGNGGLNCFQGSLCQNTTRTSEKKKKKSSDSTSRSNLQLSGLDVLLCFCFSKCNLLCSPVVFFFFIFFFLFVFFVQRVGREKL